MNKIVNKVSLIFRFSFLALVNALGVALIANITPGVEIDRFAVTIVLTVIFAVLNAAVYPVFARFALPLTVLSLGLGSLIINGILIIIVAEIIPGIEVANLGSAILFTFGIAITNTIVSGLFAIDDDETFVRNVIKKEAKKHTTTPVSKINGVVFVQIDGLSYNVLKRAIQSGNAPNINNWIREGKFRFERWETGWQSQTGASQAGILMGSNKNIPAFRWFDKKIGKSIAVSNRNDLKILEKELSNGKGLLFDNGASRGNLFSGDASDTMLTVSAIGRKNKSIGHSYYAYYSNPYNLPRTISLFIVDIARELVSIVQQRRRNVWPRITKHKKSYPFLRAAMTIIQRDIVIQTLIADIYEGKNVVYADLVGYDEVAHHTGPERHETLGVLRDIDKQVGRLLRAMENSDRRYNLVLLSDHGQTQGVSFKQATGYGLDKFVDRITSGTANVTSDLENKEDVNMLQTAVFDITKTGGLVGKAAQKVNTKDRVEKKAEGNLSHGDIKVLASGALGLIYFAESKNRLTLEEIEKLHPNLIEGLISHPLIGFILVDTKNKGAVALGRNGKIFIKSGKVIGENPLAIFGKNTLEKVRKTDRYRNVADIMVNSIYDPVMDEVYAFEEQVGSHGALGGDQNFPFVLFPSNWYFPQNGVLGAEDLHVLFKKWLKKLGQQV